MRGFLNIAIFEKNELITIRFSYVGNRFQQEMLPSDLGYQKEHHRFELSKRYKNLQYQLNDFLAYFTTEEVKQAFTPHDEGFKQFYTNKKELLTYSAISYKFSVIPPIAIAWLMCLSNYVNYLKVGVDAIFFSEKDFLNELSNSIDISEYVKHETNIGFNSILVLLEKLGSFNHLTKYQFSLSVIKELQQVYKIGRESINIKDKQPLTYFNNPQDQINFLVPSFLKPKISIHERQALLIAFSKKMVEEDKEKFRNILNFMEFLVKKNLFEQIMHERNFLGEKYKWEDMEWNFLKKVTFLPNNKGCIEMKIPPGAHQKQNSSSQKDKMAPIYKYFGLNHQQPQNTSAIINEPDSAWIDRIKFMLGESLKLEFNLQDNLQKICFSQKSSGYLKEQGLSCFQHASLKKLLYINNNLMFFSRNQSKSPETSIVDLPTELQEKILIDVINSF